MQVEDDVEAVCEKEIDVALDGLPVNLAHETRRGGAVIDTEPAVFVEGDAHRIGAPAADREDGRLIDRDRGDAEVFGAHVFGAAHVRSMKLHRPSGGVDEDDRG